ncbi:hypothetical protein ACILDV_00130 [Capnocytophaga canimorsus]|uniref:hypothetical protein n=1 Tax=Capnocytophaga canimorsus TaxID=28188 RepID=UPI0037D912E7
MKQKFFSRWFAIGMIAAALVMIGCSKDNKNDEPTPPPLNAVMIDGETRSIVSVQTDKGKLDKNRYEIDVYLGEDEYIKIFADYENHDGKVIDLTEKESEHGGQYWSVEYKKAGKYVCVGYGEPDEVGTPVFQSGTLYIKRLDDANGQPVFEIKLENGKVENSYGDGKEHTISLYYKGKLRLHK